MTVLASILQVIASFFCASNAVFHAYPAEGTDTLMILRNDYYQVSEDVSLRMDILGNDQFSFDPNFMDFGIVHQPSHGILSKEDDLEMLYTPAADFHGLDSLQYQICPTDGPCQDAWVKIMIHPVNDPPVVRDDLDTLWEDQGGYIDILANDSDAADGKNVDMRQVSIVQSPSYGTVYMDSVGGMLYKPNADYFGNDMFRYQLCDDGPGQICDSASVRLFIASVNDAPILNPDTFITYHAFPVVIDVLSNDSDEADQVAALDTNSLEIIDLMNSIPEKASIYVDYPVGLIIFTPPVGFIGTYTFQYSACDRDAFSPLCDTTHVTIQVKDELPTFH